MNSNFIYRLLAGLGGDTSSKRFLMLWLGVMVWTFIHVMVFLLIKPFPADTASNLILYDVVLIMGFGGLTVSERIWGKDKTPDQK